MSAPPEPAGSLPPAYHHQQQQERRQRAPEVLLRTSFFVRQPELRDRIGRLPDIPLNPPRCLLYGPQRSGKATLLFHYAVQLAAQGAGVVVLADRTQLEQAPPLLPAGVDARDEALGRVSFKYVEGLAGLRNYGACLHLLPRPPSAVLVSDVSALAASSRLPDRRARDAELTKALAFLADATDQLRERRSVSVLLLVSDVAAAEGPQNLYLLLRWFPVALCITGTPGGLLTLSVAPGSREVVPPAAARASVSYRLTQTYMHVEHVSL